MNTTDPTLYTLQLCSKLCSQLNCNIREYFPNTTKSTNSSLYLKLSNAFYWKLIQIKLLLTVSHYVQPIYNIYQYLMFLS